MPPKTMGTLRVELPEQARHGQAALGVDHPAQIEAQEASSIFPRSRESAITAVCLGVARDALRP
jgi:hypothetical protein